VETADRDALYQRPLHPYTVALLSALPVPDPARRNSAARERILLAGDAPTSVAPPSGCRFRTRCWKAQQICTTQQPPLDQKVPGHLVACHFPMQERERTASGVRGAREAAAAAAVEQSG
jgi:peptide/nickel transport system ATP-binding protein